MDFCIASIYAPNVEDPSFFYPSFTTLSTLSNATLVTGGDFNAVCNSDLLTSPVLAQQLNNARHLKFQNLPDHNL